MSKAMNISGASSRVAWNKGRLVGQKRPLLPKEVWAIRVRLQINGTLAFGSPPLLKPLGGRLFQCGLAYTTPNFFSSQGRNRSHHGMGISLHDPGS